MAIKKYNVTQTIEQLQADLNKIEAMPEVEAVQSGLEKANSAYQKPGTGIPSTDLAPGVIPDVSSFITKSVDDLVNYYLKSETYTKEEVGQMLSALSNGAFVPVAELPTASAETFGLKIYLVPSANPAVENLKDEFITVRSGEEGAYTYDWEQIGSTAVDLSGYVTTEALNTALASYVTSTGLETILANYSTTTQMNAAISAVDKVFVAVYGTTTADEVIAAKEAGKVVICVYSDGVYSLSNITNSLVCFAVMYEGTVRYIRINRSNNTWTAGTDVLQKTAQRVDTLAGNESDTNKYPSTKAVADALPVAITAAEIETAWNNVMQ